MFKIIYFLWRRPGMSHDDFARYYEEKHTHNNARIRPASADYRRNYPVPADPWSDPEALERLGGFDVLAENWYPERAGFERVMKAITTSPGRELIAEDEARFEVREKKKVFVVDEVGGLDFQASDYEARATRNEAAGFKIIRYVKAAPPLSVAEFRDGYEAEIAPREARIFAAAVDYRRSYLLPDDPMSFTGSHDAPTPATSESFGWNLVEEFWYASRASAEPDIVRHRQIAGTGTHGIVEDAETLMLAFRECRTPRPSALALLGTEAGA